MNNSIIARIGTLAVTENEVAEMTSNLAKRGQDYNNSQGRNMIIEQLIANKLLLLDAQKNLLEHSAEFKAQMQKIKEEMLVNFSMSKILGEIKPVSESEAEKYYNENKEQFVSGETVNASHILVDDQDKANKILEEINNGKISFEDAARENSSCPSSENGGSLGEFTRGQMVPEFDNAVFSMEQGEISSPVKTQFGYHLIKLISKSNSKTLEFGQAKDRIINMITQEKQQKVYQSKINQLKILYPVDMV